MKKAVIIIISLILSFTFITSASANDYNNQNEESYVHLESLAKKIVKDENTQLYRLSDLSSNAINYLKECNIDDNSAKLVFFSMDTIDNVLNLNIIGTEEDGAVSIATIADYGSDESGNYQRIDNKLALELTRYTWYSTYADYSKTYNNVISIYAKIYYNVASDIINYCYVRPYKSDFMITNIGANNYAVMNFYGQAQVEGNLYGTDGSFISSEYIWYTEYSILNVIKGITYTRNKSLPVGMMIELIPNWDYGMFFSCSFTMSGTSHSTSFRIYTPN